MELSDFTNMLISSPKKRGRIKRQAKIDAMNFSLENFKKNIKKLI
jgi:hypothetical protein